MHKKFQKPKYCYAIVQIIQFTINHGNSEDPQLQSSIAKQLAIVFRNFFCDIIEYKSSFCSFSFDSSFFLSKDYRSLAKNVFIVDTNLRPLILIRSATRLANLLIVIVGWSALLSNKISYEATKTILKTILQQDNCV